MTFVFRVLYYALNTHRMKYIFESPDGGKTVYKRAVGTEERMIVSDNAVDERADMERWLAWKDILKAAKHRPDLAEVLDQAQVLYELTRSES